MNIKDIITYGDIQYIIDDFNDKNNITYKIVRYENQDYVLKMCNGIYVFCRTIEKIQYKEKK